MQAHELPRYRKTFLIVRLDEEYARAGATYFLEELSRADVPRHSSHEKAKKQLVIINVDLYFDAAVSSRGDKIESVVDYDFVRTEIQRISQERHFNLQETLCEEILAICLAKKGVLAARISTEKPEAYADCEAVGYELFWRKDLPQP